MEERQIETPKPSKQCFSFPPPRRRQLNSATYRTLVRILSHCYDELSQQSLAAPNLRHELITDSGSNESGKRDVKEESEHVELVVTDNMELGIQASHGATELDLRFDDTVSQYGMTGSTQTAIDHIEHMMNKEENEDVLNRINATVKESTFGIGLEDLGFSREQILIHELEHIAKGNDDLVHENSLKPSTALLDQNESDIDEVKMLNNQEEHIDFQRNVITKSENASQNICGSFDSHLGSTLAAESSNPRASYEVKTKLLDNTLPITQQNDREMENTVSEGGSDKYPSLNAEVGEIEEGEHHNHEASETIDMSLDKNIFAEASKCSNNHDPQSFSPEANAMIIEHEMLTKDEEPKTSDCKSDAADSANYMTEDEDIEEGEISVDCGVDANSMDMVLQNAEVLEDKKKDAELQNKKKRGPPSKEKKAKKKKRDRKKRADKNRQLGVKRLKLVPMSKPKTPTFCRHFLKGRCQEGDKCKFSHDTIPLTKSKPCCHFARHSCMKGDDCPFDHQLSKYPCSNFASMGSCNRGDDCMFSHKIPHKEDTANASNVMKPELKSTSLLDNSRSKEKLISNGASQKNYNALCHSKEIHSRVYNKQNTKDAVSKQSEAAPKGTSFLSVQNSLLVDSSKLRQGSLFGNNSAGAKAGNHIHQNASIQNSSEILHKTPPAVPPKGINFLSFGKVPSGNSNSKKLASLPLCGDGVKRSVSDNSNLHDHDCSTSNSCLMPNGSQHSVAPKGINFLSIGKASVNDSGCKEKSSLPYGRDNGTDSCVKDEQTALDKPQSSSTISLAERSPSCPVSSVQFSGNLASRIYKDTPLSAQKALLSTLAFAAKCESGVKPNQSVDAPAVNAETLNETRSNNGNSGSSQNDTGKATKILEFLSRFGCKTQQ
ncbi:zinc finger CCCH domain-containing protein 7 isoform X2 [Ziziphus jujuba]|uniref:Zinc finger CCCH domain-containing protein 7 isoform X2 n=1 Tax=Ziziphus jujuba TaxID=326968 RepID=A0ABM4AEB9_ZIZJJ|nr:zinc finger CCCH domain-containing protein 7 isoform X2 [Ziziphus jujuba]